MLLSLKTSLLATYPAQAIKRAFLVGDTLDVYFGEALCVFFFPEHFLAPSRSTILRVDLNYLSNSIYTPFCVEPRNCSWGLGNIKSVKR